jgi:hypothetical protein
MAKVCVAARAMNNVKLRCDLEQLKIFLRQFIQMGDEPSRVQHATIEHQRQWRGSTTILHRPADAFHKIEQLSATLTEHFHFFLGFREMRRQQQIGTRRDPSSFGVGVAER